MKVTRRQFVKGGMAAFTVTFAAPELLSDLARAQGVRARNLVILYLGGGNDALSTLIPYRDAFYYSRRPTIAVPAANVLQIGTDASRVALGLHPRLTGLKQIFDQGKLAVIQRTGYPNQTRSHFLGTDIWSTADPSNPTSNGWVGRYLDAQCRGCDKPTQAMELDDVLSLALKGQQNKGLAFKDPKKLFNTSNSKYFKELNADHKSGEENVDYLYKTMSETISSADYIYKQSRLQPSGETYPATGLGKDLKTIASLIFSDINTKVYYVSIGSFDTHVNQDNQQKRLFTELNDAVKAFAADLKKNNRFQDVLMMTFSEFGRRVAQNASGGTDHGTANNMFFISGGLKKQGLLNGMPDLSDLNEGDLKHKVDFKNVYATVLNKWLGADDREILGGKFEYLDFI